MLYAKNHIHETFDEHNHELVFVTADHEYITNVVTTTPLPFTDCGLR